MCFLLQIYVYIQIYTYTHIHISSTELCSKTRLKTQYGTVLKINKISSLISIETEHRYLDYAINISKYSCVVPEATKKLLSY